MPRQNITASTVPAETVPAATRATGNSGQPIVQGSRKSRRIQEKADKVAKSCGNSSTKQPDTIKTSSITKKGSKKSKVAANATIPEAAPEPTPEAAVPEHALEHASEVSPEVAAIYASTIAAHVGAPVSAPVSAPVVAPVVAAPVAVAPVVIAVPGWWFSRPRPRTCCARPRPGFCSLQGWQQEGQEGEQLDGARGGMALQCYSDEPVPKGSSVDWKYIAQLWAKDWPKARKTQSLAVKYSHMIGKGAERAQKGKAAEELAAAKAEMASKKRRRAVEGDDDAPAVKKPREATELEGRSR
jgi:hypothetical protein